MRSLTRGMAAPVALAALLRLPSGPLGPVLEAAQPRWLWPALRTGAGARHAATAADAAGTTNELDVTDGPDDLHGITAPKATGRLDDADGDADQDGDDDDATAPLPLLDEERAWFAP